ncbi:MAG: trypsin-like peptidase domain-containing protein [Rhodoferax sp.]|nr:trypsin-like peptidase domain-containing protein [Rhodoferax sp.]
MTGLVLVGLLANPAQADLPDTVARIKPAIVVVGSYRSTDNPRFRMHGTGFVVSDGNHAVTNLHVLPEANENMANATLVVQVRREGGELSMRQATVLRVDKVHDLALLRFEGVAAPALRIGDSEAAREGMVLAFIGFPIGGALGFSPVTHRAMISSITPAAMPTPTARQLNEATIRSVRAGPFNIFQLDGTAYPGNSGGPLFDPASGDVLGVVNMVFIKGSRESALSQPSGISYAIPSRYVAELLELSAKTR